MSFLENLQWRFATKQFDAEKKVSDADLEKILEAIRMSPSSFGLQPFHVHVITQNELKQQLREHSWNQPQVTDASHVLVFSARLDLSDRIDMLMELYTNGDESKREQMKQYEMMMRGFSENRDDQWLYNWAAKQSYIAMGFAMAACAELQIDSCPMEGIDASKYDEILQHPAHLKTTFALPIGYRKDGPARPKVRFAKEDLFSL